MIIPTNLNECFIELDTVFATSPVDLKIFKNAKEDTAIARIHHGLGRWIRNNWGLWTKDTKLYNTFNEMQLWHADDMSSIILTSYHRYINGVEINLKEQVDYYINYWEEYEKTNGPIKQKQ